MPEYGLKMYNTLGTINLSSDSKAMRLHDSGYATVSARTGSLASPPIVAGTSYIDITPVTAEAILEVIDMETTLTTTDQLSIDIAWTTPVDNHWTQVVIVSYSLRATDILWKVWVHL